VIEHIVEGNYEYRTFENGIVIENFEKSCFYIRGGGVIFKHNITRFRREFRLSRIPKRRHSGTAINDGGDR